MLTVTDAAAALLETRAHRHAVLWRIVRSDSIVFRFTDHDVRITFESEPYDPAGGVEPTAHRLQGGLHAQNFEARGPITSDQITLEDLRRGLWRDAEITEYTVDWMYPSAGYVRKAKFWITETTWTGEHFEAQIEGLPRWLRVRRGGVFTRNCRWALGQGFISGIGCSVDVPGLTIRGAQVAAVASRFQFTANGTVPAGHSRNRYRFGRVIWISGQNEGFVQEVKDYGQVGARVIETFQPTPHDITTSDKFDLEPGCDKIQATCTTEYANFDEFGGFPDMPGTAALVKKLLGTTNPVRARG